MQVATSLLTSCNRLVINKPISTSQLPRSPWYEVEPISGCVRMACDIRQVCCKLSRRVASLIVKYCYPQPCCKLFQSLQMTSLNKPDFNRLVVACNLMKLTTCKKSVAFLLRIYRLVLPPRKRPN